MADTQKQIHVLCRSEDDLKRWLKDTRRPAHIIERAFKRANLLHVECHRCKKPLIMSKIASGPNRIPECLQCAQLAAAEGQTMIVVEPSEAETANAWFVLTGEGEG